MSNDKSCGVQSVEQGTQGDAQDRFIGSDEFHEQVSTMVETILLNLHHKEYRKLKGAPLWAFVRDTCAVGSTRAREMCRQYGWNPDQDGSVTLVRTQAGNHLSDTAESSSPT